jgi:hypothetical protein
MMTRTRRKIVTFKEPFSLEGIGRSLPAGSYEVITDEELIEVLSFPVYRRVATMMPVPGQISLSADFSISRDCDHRSARAGDGAEGRDIGGGAGALTATAKTKAR